MEDFHAGDFRNFLNVSEYVWLQLLLEIAISSRAPYPRPRDRFSKLWIFGTSDKEFSKLWIWSLIRTVKVSFSWGSHFCNRIEDTFRLRQNNGQNYGRRADITWSGGVSRKRVFWERHCLQSWRRDITAVPSDTALRRSVVSSAISLRVFYAQILATFCDFRRFFLL